MNTLIIFAREPVPGKTKTRLCPPLDGTTAAALYTCFLRDVLDSACALPNIQPLIAYTPESDAAFFARFAPELPIRPQRGASLGERMHHAMVDVGCTLLEVRLNTNAAHSPDHQSPISSAAVLIGSDAPTLPPAFIADAFTQLDAGADVVLGPSDDGGYYLIGLRTPQPRLLCEVTMSTATVLADTLAIAHELGLRVVLLPPWYDIDTAAELQRLAAELRDAAPDVAPATRAFLECAAITYDLGL